MATTPPCWFGLDAARRRLRSADEVLQLSHLFKEAGEIDAALELAGWGLDLKPEDGRLVAVIALARWLRDSAAALGKSKVAMRAAGVAFAHSLALEDYEAGKMLAAKEWPAHRRRFLACLETAEYARERTGIYFGEGMIDEAVRSVDVENALRDPANGVLLRLAEAAHASHGDWVIDIAQRLAANIMDTGQAGLYELAARWLEVAALSYDASDRFEDWITTIDGLIEKHHRKHKLRPLLTALRQRF